MATIFRWEFLRALLAMAALSVALPVVLIGCGGDDTSSPPTAPPMVTTEAPTSPGGTPEPRPTQATRSAGQTSEPQPTQAGASTTTIQESPTQPPTEVAEPADKRDRTLTVYSGRSQSLVHPLLEAFGESTGVDIRVKYGGKRLYGSYAP